jgi:hypothetical protein
MGWPSAGLSATAGGRPAAASSRLFYLVEPVWAVRDDGRFGRQAEIKGLKHAPKIGGGSEKNEIRG